MLRARWARRQAHRGNGGVATQAEAEEAERAAMEAIRGDARLPDIGQEDRETVDPHTVTR